MFVSDLHHFLDLPNNATWIGYPVSH